MTVLGHNPPQKQLKDNDNKSSEKNLRKCVHCGFCNATCPTFKLLGDELDGPRGRIYLIKDMLENRILDINPKTLPAHGLCLIGVNYKYFNLDGDQNEK